MQGLSNDYIYVDCFREPVPSALPELARRISDRRLGVGADGLILIHPSAVADARMQMFNADGSEAEMCGNGLRCVARYLFDHGHCARTELQLETGAGLLTAALRLDQGVVAEVTIDMGRPRLAAAQVPTTLPERASELGTAVIEAPLTVAGHELRVTCVSMGNPHCVVFVPLLTSELVGSLGPLLTTHPAFPRGANIEFVQVQSRTRVTQRTWERGSGETWACGTGACAVAVAGALTDRTERDVRVQLTGGELRCDWRAESGHVFMTGPAVEVFSGEYPSAAQP